MSTGWLRDVFRSAFGAEDQAPKASRPKPAPAKKRPARTSTSRRRHETPVTNPEEGMPHAERAA
jgi:hypothetical protein